MDDAKIVVGISDLHCLSTWGLLRPGFKTKTGNEIGLNPFQEWLWECHTSILDELDALVDDDPFILICNGDLTDGNHHRTKEILAVDENEHINAAVYTLDPLSSRADSIYCTAGTPCHCPGDEVIAKELEAERCPDTGNYAFPDLWLRVNGCLGTARHHMPTTSRVYLEASQLSIQLGNAQLARQRAGMEPPKWLMTSHRHRQGYYSDGHAMSIVLPAWQGLTEYCRKVVPDAIPNPGVAVLDWRGKPPGSLPVPHLLIRTPAPPKEVVQ